MEFLPFNFECLFSCISAYLFFKLTPCSFIFTFYSKNVCEDELQN